MRLQCFKHLSSLVCVNGTKTGNTKIFVGHSQSVKCLLMMFIASNQLRCQSVYAKIMSEALKFAVSVVRLTCCAACIKQLSLNNFQILFKLFSYFSSASSM